MRTIVSQHNETNIKQLSSKQLSVLKNDHSSFTKHACCCHGKCYWLPMANEWDMETDPVREGIREGKRRGDTGHLELGKWVKQWTKILILLIKPDRASLYLSSHFVPHGPILQHLYLGLICKSRGSCLNTFNVFSSPEITSKAASWWYVALEQVVAQQTLSTRNWMSELSEAHLFISRLPAQVQQISHEKGLQIT